jgi:amino acid adenylation domain-containing protein/non-ribosomal peptide synthase protein (TIGR01720 family)
MNDANKKAAKEELIQLLKSKLAQEELPHSLSAMQMSLAWHQFQYPNSVAYNVAISVIIHGEVHIELLKNSWQELCSRHKILISRYPLINNKLSAVIKNTDFEIKVFDTENQSKKIVDNKIKEFTNQVFDLQTEQLFRLAVFRQNKNEYILVIVLHHIITDLWSVNILIRDFFAIYASKLENKSFQLPELKADYFTFINEEKKFVESNKGLKQLKYWIEKLKDAPVKSMIAPDFISEGNEISGDTVTVSIPYQVHKTFNEFLKKHDFTLNVGYLTILYLVLYKHTQQDDLIIGSTAARRESQRYANALGCFINPIALRVKFDAQSKVRDAFKSVNETIKEAMLHQNYPFSVIVSKLKLPRLSSITPIFQVGYELQQARTWDEVLKRSAVNLKPYLIDQQEGQLDLALSVFIEKNNILLKFKYNTNIYRKETIEWIAKHYRNILSTITDIHDLSLDAFSMTDDIEKNLVISQWNKTEKTIPEITYVDIFKNIVNKNPSKIALEYQNQSLNYEELDLLTNQLARLLSNKLGNKKGVIAIFMEKSIDLMASLISIGKAGYAYLPLELDMPDERIKYIIEQSKVNCIITSSIHQQKIQHFSKPSCKVLYYDQFINEVKNYSNQALDKKPAFVDPAYIIYTSGSTGRPKGVIIKHSGMINRLNWMKNTFHINSDSKILQKTPIVFDVSVWEIFLPLISGATLVIAEQGGHLDPVYLGTLVQEKNVTDLHFVPTMLDIFIKQKMLSSLAKVKHIYCSGEALTKSTVETVVNQLPAVKVYNLYGPTEASIDVSYWHCDPIYVHRCAAIPIGKPIDNVKLYVLDKYKQPCAIGQAGELYISGICLAAGYIGNSIQTKAAFIANPFMTSKSYELMYKTGDIAKWSSIGDIEYLGRNDRQVKIRGFRIELTEIESVIMKIKAIDKCVVLVKKINDQDNLVAYCVLKDKEISISMIKKRLQDKLPFYMIPNEIILLDQIPTTISGKIDTQQLLSHKVIKHERKDVEIPLTPIQSWFFSQKPKIPSHWNLSFLFKCKEKLEYTHLKQTLTYLVEQHDALRLRFAKRRDQWHQYYAHDQKVYDVPIEHHRLSDSIKASHSEIIKICNKVQKSLNISTGPILRLALIVDKNNESLLFICVHHLVIDAVSWQILLNDLTNYYQQISTKQILVRETKSSSYLDWSKALQNYSISNQQITYWESKARDLKISINRLVSKKHTNKNIIKTVNFSDEITRKLLLQKDLMQPVLLFAVSRAFKAVFNEKKLLVDIEQHGRDHIQGIDVTNTIGWFTNIYPLELRISHEGFNSSDTNQIMNLVTKLQLEIEDSKNNSIAYGILRYSHKNKVLNKIHSRILFNYLGNISRSLHSKIFEVFSWQDFKNNVSTKNKSPYLLIINAFISDNILSVRFEFSSNFLEDDVEKICTNFNEILIKISSSIKTQIKKEIVKPINEVEANLLRLWRELLGIENISVDDNFFLLGGDSLLAMQLSSKIKDSGLNVVPRMIYTYPTISELAQHVSQAKSVDIQTGDIKNNFPLIPSHKRFFNDNFGIKNVNYYNASILVKLNEKLSVNQLNNFFKVIAKYHDAFKIHFHQVIKNHWEMYYIDESEINVPIYQYDYSKNQENSFQDFILAHCEKLKNMLNVESGPTFIIALFTHCPDDHDRLLIVSNQMLSDLYSVNVILRNIYTLYKKYKHNEKLELSSATSYRNLALKLNEKFTTDVLLNRLPYWKKVAAAIRPFPADHMVAETAFQDKDVSEFQYVLLDKKQLKELLAKYENKTLSNSVHDITLAAWLLAVKNIFKINNVSLDIVNSGREGLDSHDLAETIGNISTFIPMNFNLSDESKYNETIAAVKQKMEYADNYPFEFELLLADENDEIKKVFSNFPETKALYVYLGKMRDNYQQMHDLYSRADELLGPARSPGTSMPYYLFIYTGIYDDSLMLYIRYNKNCYAAATINSIAKSMRNIILSLLDNKMI